MTRRTSDVEPHAHAHTPKRAQAPAVEPIRLTRVTTTDTVDTWEGIVIAVHDTDALFEQERRPTTPPETRTKS